MATPQATATRVNERVIVQFAQSPFYGGPERQMIGLARALPAPYRAAFFSFTDEGGSQGLLDAARKSGFDTVALTRDLPNLPGMILQTAAKLRAVNARIVCCHNYKATIVGLAAARLSRIPCIGVSHGWTAETRNVRLYEACDRWALRRMDAVVGVSAAQALKLRKAGVRDERIHIIRNALAAPPAPLANPVMRASLEALFPRPPSYIVGAAGRLSYEKGFDQLVLAAAQVVQRDPNVGFVLFGEGIQREALSASIEACGLTKSFVLAGFRSDLEQVLPNLDVVVLPSRTEGLPVIALEAMAARVPVVATAVGGTPEALVDGICGYLVPPENPEALANRLLDVLASDERRAEMGARGRERVLSTFTFEEQAATYAALFEKLAP
jgi:glycosyltransferase involved in cell wall biosynthesis